MPYKIERHGDTYCVVKEPHQGKPGKTMHCYDDKAKALAYLRALEANASEDA